MEGLEDVDFLSDLLLLWELIVVVNYLRPLSASLPGSYFPLVSRRVEVLCFVVEDKTNKA